MMFIVLDRVWVSDNSGELYRLQHHLPKSQPGQVLNEVMFALQMLLTSTRAEQLGTYPPLVNSNCTKSGHLGFQICTQLVLTIGSHPQ
jgi:hypothetical protein